MITIENVSKNFFVRGGIFHLFKPPRKIGALQSVSLTISKNEIVAIIGPNGAGKTTLLKIMCGLIIPETGTVRVCGTIGYISGENEGFYPQLTARQNLKFFGTLYDLSSQQIRQRIDEYRTLINFGDLDKPFWHYSSGMKRKLALLRLLMLQRDIIIMDEPTKSIDYATSETLRQLIPKLTRGHNKTVIFTTHSLNDTQIKGAGTAIMSRGKLSFHGNIDESSLKTLYQKTCAQND